MDNFEVPVKLEAHTRDTQMTFHSMEDFGAFFQRMVSLSSDALASIMVTNITVLIQTI